MAFHGSAALIADDDDFFRLAMRVLLTKQLGFKEVFETRSLDDAIECMGTQETVGFALFDLNLEGLDTFSGIRATRETFPDIKVAVVSASRDRNDVLRALEAGAHGFVPKGEGVKQLEDAVKAMFDGQIYVPTFVTDIRNAPKHAFEEVSLVVADDLVNVTARQREVLTYVLLGKSNKEIARSLHVSESAVKFHVASLCGRLGVKNRTEVAAQAARVAV